MSAKTLTNSAYSGHAAARCACSRRGDSTSKWHLTWSVLGILLTVVIHAASGIAAPARRAAEAAGSSAQGIPSVAGNSVPAAETASNLPDASAVNAALGVAKGNGLPAVAPGAGQTSGATLTLRKIIQEAISVGFEARLANIAVDAARGDAKSFAAVANPAVSFGFGRALGYDPSVCSRPGCSPNQYSVGLSDQAAFSDVLSGKRGLRQDVGHLSVRIAGLQRDEAVRAVKLAVKQQYAATVFSQARLGLAQRVLQKTQDTEGLVQARYNSGAPLPDLLRAQAVVLDAQSRLRAAQIQLEADRAQLAVMMGRPGLDSVVFEESLLAAPPPLVTDIAPLAPRWIEQAKSTRPDRIAANAAVEQSEAALRLARRNRWPDIELQVGYTQQGLGSNAIQPGTLSATITAPIPVLYQNQGQIDRALADEAARSVERKRLDLQISSAVRTALANAASAWAQTQYEEQRLERARHAVDMVRLQYQEGATSLVDLLEATSSAIDAEEEYLTVREAMWNRVFQLEYASGKELVQ